MDITLGKIMNLEDPTVRKVIPLFGHIYELYLPTDVLIFEPRIVTPHIARVYRTGQYDYNGGVVSYQTLMESEGKNFKGCGHFPEVHLWEVWENGGCDGHTHYELVGYVFLSEATHPVHDQKRYPPHGLSLPHQE